MVQLLNNVKILFLILLFACQSHKTKKKIIEEYSSIGFDHQTFCNIEHKYQNAENCPNSVFMYSKICDSLESITNPENIKLIGFRNIKFEYLPNNLIKFKNLERIDCFMTDIIEIPTWINQFKKLKMMKWQRNPNLTSLPKELFECKNMETLLFFKSAIDSIPDDIKKLKKLKSINFPDNKIVYVSSNITSLDQIEQLIFDKNLISTFDIVIADMKHLKEIRLNGNQINNETIERLKQELISGCFTYTDENNKFTSKCK